MPHDIEATAEQVFAAPEGQLVQTGIPRPTAHNIVEFHDFDPLEKELCELPRLGARLVKWPDPDYPVNLRHIADPPPYIFVRGTLTPNDPIPFRTVVFRIFVDEVTGRECRPGSPPRS